MTDVSMASAATRFGYGLPADFGSLHELIAGPGGIGTGAPASIASRDRIIEEHKLRSSARKATGAERERRHNLLRRAVAGWYQSDQHSYVAQAVASRRPFFSRLVEFWANHFTVSVKKGTVRGLAGPFVYEAIQPHVLGRFEDLLIAAELHPAMVIYLDLMNSIGPNSPEGKQRGRGLNENLAREILELHTLGVNGGYSQTDVTEFAKIMTGWTIDRKRGEVQFAPRRVEPGAKHFIETEIGGAPSADDYSSALRLLANHPSTARFIATKLVTHFIADTPPAEAVGKVEAAFRETGGNLPEVYRALLDLPEAQQLPGAKARTDFDFVVASLRVAEVPLADLEPFKRQSGRTRPNALSVGALADMQQRLWFAPSPAGWPEKAEEWLGPVALAQRLRWIARVTGRIKDRTAAEFLDRALGPLASQQTRSIVMAASNREEGLALVLASPEFNRR